MKTVNYKQRVYSWDFIRVICTFAIILFHLSCKLAEINPGGHFLLYQTANSDWGSLLVTAFFVLSGASLFYNYSVAMTTIQEIKKYYLKRIKNIMIPYWVTWLLVYPLKSIESRTLIWGGPLYKLILTFLGLDGYTLYLGNNYYQIGEWFLGALVIIYALYPLLLILFHGYFQLSTFLIAVAFVWIINFNPFKMSAYRNIIVCILAFWCGMIFCKFREKLEYNHYLGAASILVVLAVSFINISVNSMLVRFIGGVCLFISLNYIFILLKVDGRPLLALSSGSYMVYLTHHRIISVIGFLVGKSIAKREFFAVAFISILIAVLIYTSGMIYYYLYNLVMKELKIRYFTAK